MSLPNQTGLVSSTRDRKWSNFASQSLNKNRTGRIKKITIVLGYRKWHFELFPLFTNKLNHFFPLVVVVVYCFTAHLFKCMLTPTNVGIQWLFQLIFRLSFRITRKCERIIVAKLSKWKLEKTKTKKKTTTTNWKIQSAVSEWQWHRLHMLALFLFLVPTCTFSKQFQMFWHCFSWYFDDFLFRCPHCSVEIRWKFMWYKRFARSPSLSLVHLLVCSYLGSFNAVFVHVMHLYL